MSEAQFLADELTSSVAGDPWYGLSMLALLEGVDAASAAAHPPGVHHSIWEIVLHTRGWAREMARRFQGGERGEPAGGNWPAVGAAEDDRWERAKADLRDAHAEVAAAMQVLDGDLDRAPEGMAGDDGRPVTFGRMAAGLSQHVAYHAGQIAVIKQLLGLARAED